MHVLAVDDSRTVLHAIKVSLEHLGHTVTACLTYADGLRAAGQTRFDVLVTDYIIGPLTGIQLSSMTGLPTALITGSNLTVAEQQEINRFRSEGWPVLTKPFFRADLEKAIRDAIQQEKATNAAY